MADTITLRYRNTVAETVAWDTASSGTFEVNIGDWVDEGAFVISRDTGVYRTGVASGKIITTGPGSAANYVINSGFAGFELGKSYKVSLYAKGGAGSENFDLFTASTTGAHATAVLSSSDWTLVELSFEATAADVADSYIKIWLDDGVTVYIDDVVIYCYDHETTVNVLVEKGLSRAEKYTMYPQIMNDYLDGSKDTQYQAFIRQANIRTVALTDTQLQAFLYWTLDNDRLFDYDIQSVTESDLVLIPEPEQEAQWYDDCRLMPYVEFNVSEGSARTVWP
jgi:hypothetical protein